MAREKWIYGKKDDTKHDGYHSYLKRRALSEDEIIDFWTSVWPEIVEAVHDEEMTERLRHIRDTFNLDLDA